MSQFFPKFIVISVTHFEHNEKLVRFSQIDEYGSMSVTIQPKDDAIVFKPGEIYSLEFVRIPPKDL